MTLHLNDAGFRRDSLGMPESHAEKFSQVARDESCVILSRAVGPTCRQLLEQGYDTKGFRIHGKSCNWGPMAGFVLRDPRLNKSGLANEAYNRKEHRTALTDRGGAGWLASTTPLKLYADRVRWLQRQGKINLTPVDGGTRYEGIAHHQSGVTFRYALIFEPSAGVWGVYLDNQRNPNFRQEVGGASRVYHRTSRWSRSTRFEALLAMTNPPTHRSWPQGDFRNAITGDYDLFGLWAHTDIYQHHGDDRRALGTASGWSHRHLYEKVLEPNFTETGQATKLGNMTDRLYLVSQLLNSAVGGATTEAGRTWGPFPSRMVCWHSDESARPFVNDVDLPVVAFTPWGPEVGISSIDAFKSFISECVGRDYQVTLGEGWTLEPTQSKPNRLGQAYAHLVPNWRGQHGAIEPWRIPDFYNR